MSTDPREFEHPIDGTGSTVTPLVDVIAGVLRTHDSDFTQDDWWICCSCGTDWLIENCSFSDAKAEFAAHQARAVLATISEAGTVEWGVQLSESFMENHHGSRRGADEAAKETGSHVITRVTLPWERAE